MGEERKMGMADVWNWPTTPSTATWGQGNFGPPLPPPPKRIKLPAGGTIIRRKPEWPFSHPTCGCLGREKRARWIGWQKHRFRFWYWNIYRCPKCATGIWPERFYHRALPWLFPF